MSDHEAALAELDRIGRQATSDLKDAARRIMAEGNGPGGAVGAVSANGESRRLGVPGEPLLFDLPPVADGERRPVRAPARRRRLVLAAAGIAAVAGLGVAQLAQRDHEPQAEATVGAPTAALGDEPGGIYPPDAEHRPFAVTDPEGSEMWDQWSLSLPPAGEHLLVDLRSGDTELTSVLAGLGSAPLRVGRLDAADALPGAEETAVFGSVDAVVAGTGTGGGSVTVERPGAAPVEVHVEPIDGADHNVFIGFVPGDLGPDAQVVAVGPDGVEVARVPVPSGDGGPGEGDGGGGGGDPGDSIYPHDPDHAPVTVLGSDEDPRWGAQVLEGGRYVVLGATGNEDSVSTVIERPGSTALQVLATRLDGHPDRPVVVVYGLVAADAAEVELTAPGSDPVPLRLEPIDGATHQAFGAIVPPDVSDSAVVVARDASGQEIGRRPLAWTLLDASER
jgi:hypothetical protein